MPHLVLEYSANLTGQIDFDALSGGLHHALAEAIGVDIAHFKSRARRCEEYRIGDGKPGQAFVHLQVRLLRPTADDQQKAGDVALELLRVHLSPKLRAFAWQLTVDLGELDQATYRKTTGGNRS